MNYNCKISENDITYGPRNPDDLCAQLVAHGLHKDGYIGISNAYCLIGKIDRSDWIEKLAMQRRCSPADFYNLDGSGIDDRHREYYIRSFSEDKLTIHPLVYQFLKKYQYGSL